MFTKLIDFLSQIPNFENYLLTAIAVFPRFAGFLLYAPAFSRKDIPAMVKIAFVFIMTIAFVEPLGNTPPPAETHFFLVILLNYIFGTLMGFVTRVIFETIRAAGEMINMQMGLQSAMMFDPSIKSQSSLMGRFFTQFGTILFINIGGFYWLLLAFKRGFDIFPLYATQLPLEQIVHLDYIIFLTGNVLFIGLQMASPVIITTLCQDVILGVISKTAPQVNVFQLSFLFKPTVGTILMLILLPLMMDTIIEYLIYYSKFF